MPTLRWDEINPRRPGWIRAPLSRDPALAVPTPSKDQKDKGQKLIPGDYGRRAGAGAATGGVVIFLSRSFDSWVVNSAIQREFKARDAEVRSALPEGWQGGILAVARIIVRYDPSMVIGGGGGQRPVKNFGSTASRLAAFEIGRIRYAEPSHAIGVRDNRISRHGSISVGCNPTCEYIEERFFWGHWV